MAILNFTDTLDLLDPTTVVNEVVIGLILAFFGIVGVIIAGIVVFNYKWKRAEERKRIEKLERENKKEIERKNEKRAVSEMLLSEIEGNQDQLRPFSDCVTKVLDNDIETSEEERFPNELNFNRNIYSEFSGRFGLLDSDSRTKIHVYYHKLEVIEKGYPKLNIHESSSLDGQKINQGHPFSHLVRLMFDEKFGKHTNLNEIEAFLRNAKEVYEFGEELIISLKG